MSLFLDREEHPDYPAMEVVVQWTSDGTNEAALLDIILVGRSGSLPADSTDTGYAILQAGIQGFLNAVRAADVSTAFGTFNPPLTVLAWSVDTLEEYETNVSANYS